MDRPSRYATFTLFRFVIEKFSSRNRRSYMKFVDLSYSSSHRISRPHPTTHLIAPFQSPHMLIKRTDSDIRRNERLSLAQLNAKQKQIFSSHFYHASCYFKILFNEICLSPTLLHTCENNKCQPAFVWFCV